MILLSSAAELQGFSGFAVACMIFSMIILIGALIVSVWRLQRRWSGDARELLFGAVAYVIFIFLGVTVISSLFWMIPGVKELGERSVAFSVTFEVFFNVLEVFIMALVMSRKAEKKRTIVRYAEFGVGYAMVEMIIVGVYSVGIALMIHSLFARGGAEAMAEYFGTESEDLRAAAEMMAMPGTVFLSSMLEALLMAVFRIGMFLVILGVQKKKLPALPSYLGMTAFLILIRVPSSLVTRDAIPAGLSDFVLIAALLAGCGFAFFLSYRGLKTVWKEETEEIDRQKKASSGSGNIAANVRYSGSLRKEKHATEHNPDQGF